MHKRTVACSELFCVLVPSLCTAVPRTPVIALLHKDRRTVRFPASPQLFIGLNRYLVRLWCGSFAEITLIAFQSGPKLCQNESVVFVVFQHAHHGLISRRIAA